ncbi:unnamed protein product [Lactuca virosa]|uniref:Glutathione peroxidase n=1 Tax=Lactuca virosa TaxID=75947 RepID=A0AAU9MXJ6_9ASTR|nr:unnamed protein product [Lactuca virosa]
MASTTVTNLTPFLLVGLAFVLFYRHPSSSITLNMTQETPKSVHDFTVKDIRGNEVPLSSYSGKVLLIVNVASKCGLTESNYKELNILYQKYKNQDFEILAFPCNQFLWQEPGTNEEIQDTVCTKFKAEFPIFDKVEVNGNNASPLYKFLKSEKDMPLKPHLLNSRKTFKICWNHHLFERHNKKKENEQWGIRYRERES